MQSVSVLRLLIILAFLTLNGCYSVTKPALYLQKFSLEAVDNSFMPHCAKKHDKNWIDLYGGIQYNGANPMRMDGNNHSPVTQDGRVAYEKVIDSVWNSGQGGDYYTYDTVFTFSDSCRYDYNGFNTIWQKPWFQGNVGIVFNKYKYQTVFAEATFSAIDNKAYIKFRLGAGVHLRSDNSAHRLTVGLGLMNYTSNMEFLVTNSKSKLNDSIISHRETPVDITFQYSGNSFNQNRFQWYWGAGYTSLQMYSRQSDRYDNDIQVLFSFFTLSAGIFKSFGSTMVQTGVTLNIDTEYDMIKSHEEPEEFPEAKTEKSIYPVFQLRLSKSFEFGD